MPDREIEKVMITGSVRSGVEDVGVMFVQGYSFKVVEEPKEHGTATAEEHKEVGEHDEAATEQVTDPEYSVEKKLDEVS